MTSQRRLLWLVVVLAGLGAAVLFMSGTATATTGSTSESGSGTSTTTDDSGATSVDASSAFNSADSEAPSAESAASPARLALRPSSLISAIVRARDARSAPTQPQSSRFTADTTSGAFSVRSPVISAFELDATAVDKTVPGPTISAQLKPAIETPAPPQRPLAAVVVDVLSGLGLASRPDPPAALPREPIPAAKLASAVVSPVTVADLQSVPTLAEQSPAPTTAVTALLPSATTETGVEGVVVGHSTLTIPCGPGYEVPADWYFPTGPDPPNGVIWLQHGFLAQGAWYSTTAATLAKETNSIVVVPSITSNFLQCDGCWLNGEPMERAVASMFVDRTALTASASQAAGHAVTLPDKFVLVGHSAGGGFAVAVAGFLVGTSAIDNLVGVVMFDGVALNDNMTALVRLLPTNLPVYQIAAPSYLWNNLGSGTAQLVAARPDKFVGFQLVGGSHVDAMQGNPLISFGAQLLTGFSRPANVQAVQTLAVGWINDMYNPNCRDDAHNDDSCQGIYAQPGQTIKIGGATAIALPTPPTWFTPIETLIRNLLIAVERVLFNLINFHPTGVASDRIAA
ncbi:MAG TPA: hypothetical protein VLU24_10065 [Mycobacterium sp.]|nr:hypothetical protein [Mycobacterium sp.]